MTRPMEIAEGTKEIYLLLHKFQFKLIGPIDENEVRNAEKFFIKQGFKVVRTGKPPSDDMIKVWKKVGYGRCLDGCLSRGLCSCKHGFRSWLAVFR